MSRINLEAVRKELGDCTRCGLSSTRKNIVFGSGDPASTWMFVGEAPGANEDEQGEPFVGRSGKILNDLIKESGWSRESVYVTNIVKCRPPGNRDPAHDEVEACKPFLFRQIQKIKPVVITTIGRPATCLLLGSSLPLGRMRGKVFDLNGVSVIPTYHPSYIMRGNWSKLGLMKDDFALALTTLFSQGICPP